MNNQSEPSLVWVQKALTICFCIIILLPTFLYGAVDPILGQATAAVAFLFVALLFISQPPPPHLRSRIAVSVLAIALAVLYAAVEALRIPGNPFAHPAWALPIGPSDGRIASSISISPARTLYSIIPLTHAGLSFTGALWLARQDRQPLLFLKVFAVLSGALAILSMVQFEIAPRWLLAVPKIAYLDSLTTPFVNRNTAATFYGLAALVALITCACTMIGTFAPTDPYTRIRTSGLIKFEPLLLGLFGMASLTALILTRSRGGLLASLIAFAFYVPVFILISGRSRNATSGFGESPSRNKLTRLVLVLVTALAIVSAFVFFGQRQLFRMDVEGIDQVRLCILPRVMALAHDNLPWGTGLGTFEQAYNAYRNPQCGIYGRWLSSHNVFLDLAVTAGLPGLGLAIAVIGYLVFVLIGGTRTRVRLRSLPLGGLAALILVISHSLIDFSMEVPGFAVPFAAVLGACVAACTRPQTPTVRNKTKPETEASETPRPKDWWNDPDPEKASGSKSMRVSLG